MAPITSSPVQFSICGGPLYCLKLANGGDNSSLGNSSGAASNLTFKRTSGAGNCALTYTGSGDASDRLFTLDASAYNTTAQIFSSGTGPLNFTNAGALGILEASNVPTLISEAHNRYNKGQIEELLTGYGPLVEVFFDMGKPKLEQSIEWATLVHKLQPNCLVNGRVMNNQGDFLTMPDNQVPEVAIPQAWEAPSTLYHWSEKEIPGWNNAKMDTWGYKSGIIRPDLKVQVAKQIRKMVSVISRGGNFVLNVGPNGKGEIIPYEQDVLKTMGAWVKAHQEALFGTTHDPFKKLEWGHCTVKGATLYFFVVNWPEDRRLRIPGLKSEIKSAAMLTKKGSPLAYSKAGDDFVVTLPANAPDDVCPVVAVELGSELAIVDPLVKPDNQGQITLSRKEAIAYGHYDGMQYTSLNPNVRYGWDFSTCRAGDYSVRVSAVGVTGILRISAGDLNVELKPGSVEVVTIRLPKNERLTLSLSGENPKRTIQGKIESVTLAPL